MADDNPTPEDKKPEGGDWKAPASQEELDRIIATRLERERAKFADYDDIKAKAAEFDKVTDAQKSETQKALDRAAAAEKELQAARLESARASVALAKGLTPAQAKRLVGTTREELESDADELLNDLKPPAPTSRRTATPAGKPAGDKPGSRSVQAIRELRGTA